MKKLIMIVMTLSLLMQVTAIEVNAERDISKRRMGRHGHNLYDIDLTANAKLNLTAEQASRIRTLHERYAREIEPLRTQLCEKGMELKTEWLQPEPDRDRIAALRAEVVKLGKQMQEKLASHRTEVLDVLSVEQRARVVETEADNRRGPGIAIRQNQ